MRISRFFGRQTPGSLWTGTSPIREELFSVERLEQHAGSLAAVQTVTSEPHRVPSLHARLGDNAAVLLAAYRASAATLEVGAPIVPAAEWLLDNYHLVEAHINEIRDDLPPAYYRQLPKLSDGPFAGYPRVFGMAWAYVAHTDSHFEPEMLRRFVRAYQKDEALTIGELWAVAITLRIVLIENLRRLAAQITEGHTQRAMADTLADRLLGTAEHPGQPVATVLARFHDAAIPELIAAQLAKRLRGQDPAVTPAQAWLESHLERQGTSVEDVVRNAQQRQGASNVSVRNIITSLRAISDTDWAEWFESVSLVDVRLRQNPTFSEMDFATRNLYRSAIEDLARGSDLTEIAIADLAVAHTRKDEGDDRDTGYHLVAGGRLAFEREIGFRPRLGAWPARISRRLGIGGYVAVLAGLAALLVALGLAAIWGPATTGGIMVVLALAAFLPALDAATALVNRGVSAIFGATLLPGLELAGGVPAPCRTMVVVPTLLTSEDEINEQIERLEVHHLASIGGEISFALLSDWPDAPDESQDGDEALRTLAMEGIARLNRIYAPGKAAARFFLLHRRRLHNAAEGCWMGWERKRGKLHELNRLLRGATDTSFMGDTAVPIDVRYVVTLDGDTRLPRDTVRRLIGKMAHPLNRPRFDPNLSRVVEGHAIMQPRVTPSLPTGIEGSFYQRVYSSPGGMDAYAAAVSDVYQDLFGEGSFTGKGIYDVDMFEASLAGRVPENTMLSHDLFEGTFARAGLASDIEVVEEFPSRYDVAAKRQHRWARGDWQLLAWLGAKRGLTPLGRWKMIDNIRRTLLAPAIVVALVLGWLLLAPLPAFVWTLAVLATIAIPALLPLIFAVMPRRAGITPSSHFGALGRDVKVAASQTGINITMAASQAWLMIDAMARTLIRLFVTRRHLLEWTTAAQSKISPRLNVRGFYRQMAGGVALAILAAALVAVIAPRSLLVAAPILLAWLGAPALALLISRSPTSAGTLALSVDDATALRLVARRTWRFFETFVTAQEHHLAPDNFQDDPKPVIAHRTSPTNIGLYLLSAVAARDFGWAGLLATIERLEATLETLGQMQRFNGHFLNWYDTRDLRVLEPAYVSSVDSGNLAGHLITLSSACRGWAEAPQPAPERWSGIADNARLARTALEVLPDETEGRRALANLLNDVEARLALAPSAAPAATALLAEIKPLAVEASSLAQTMLASSGVPSSPDLVFWTSAIERAVDNHHRDVLHLADAPHSLGRRLRIIAASAHSIALGMDFAFLLDPERKLLSIGYSVPDAALDRNCYDLLASEARLASLFAIAKGDVPAKHWFRLGRSATPLGRGTALISWSGSMFEYLMPSLIMRAPAGSLLEQTNRLVVARQQEYGRALGTPWGISESAYNARDLEFTYQYSNFGVPGLGLKRGLAQDTVIAPYACGLAAMVDPAATLANYRDLAALGALGPYGFYEAVDFTPSRLPPDNTPAVVHTVMAHHQGMTIVSIANTLQGARMRARFHADPLIQASELLLQERMPRDVAVAHPRAEEVRASKANLAPDTPTMRFLGLPGEAPPITHLLSNGSYAVMLTSAGSGYSRWRDLSVTRWREDGSADDWGSYIFVRDTDSRAVWSAGYQPAGDKPGDYTVTFSEDRATFQRRDQEITTTMDVVVSAEDNAEVRRVSLTNNGPDTRRLDVTSYAELVLASAASDNAHPAFSKMFVQTEFLADRGALIATRRKRSPSDPSVWSAHLAVVEGDSLGGIEIETDRLRFLGRGHDIGTAVAIHDQAPLSGTTGTVLDPIFALRRKVEVKPGRTARLAFWTIVASSRDELIDLIDKHQDVRAFDRALTLAWTQAQVQLRHLDVTADEAQSFQRLVASVIFANPFLRPSSDTISAGMGPQSGLWPHGISGDIPIVVIRIDDVEDMANVRQILRAHEYWRMKQLAVDLVILNERASSYVQDLQIAIETAVRTSQSRPRFGQELARGGVFTLRSDLMSMEARNLVQAVARVVLTARRGSIEQQLDRLSVPSSLRPVELVTPSEPHHIGAPADLEFFNGTGGFARGGREYVVVLDERATTPAPWINVIANSGFGFQASADGSGYTWAVNSRERQLTPWSNDPVSDPTGECIFLRDTESGEVFSPTAQPIRDGGTYIARHGPGYTRFEHQAAGIAMELTQFVPLDDPIKISRLTVTNNTDRPRMLSVTSYAEWVLGTQRGAAAPFAVTGIEPRTGALTARNGWNAAFGPRVAFMDMSGRQESVTGDRREFLGRNGKISAPAALAHLAPLSGTTGAGLDPCAALQTAISLEPGASETISIFLGETTTDEAVAALVARYRTIDLDQVFAEVEAYWEDLLGAVQVKTPDRSMDIMLNGWLLYQTLACRVVARSAFYQASGAYGFRDQIQDGMALTFSRPEITRGHLLRAAGRQFPAGDVQHWWLPHSGQGVRTRISDDRAWLVFGVATYMGVTGDASILDEPIPFIEGQELQPGEHDAFFQPATSAADASLYEHCARALDQAMTLTGELGLPLMGTGDWNDGMNRVGEGGRGESVWLAWLLIRAIDLFVPLVETREPARAAAWRSHAAALREALEEKAWDGEWYRRATFDDGTWLGSKDSNECHIDSIAQSWSVLSEAALPERARQAMVSVDRHLVRRDDAMALLFTPPFDKTPHDPGYIKGYPPGLRENGGQYSHAAMWVIMAQAKLGDGEKAAELFGLLNPINHAATPDAADRYKVEPYVVAADVYSVAPHVGRGGWTWYTGSAGWMYRAGIEAILGLRKEGDELTLRPCIPAHWPGFTIDVRHGQSRFSISVLNSGKGEACTATVDGRPIELDDQVLRLALHGRTSDVCLTI
jgi:cyclic beta-1,2-glucan synthetase